MVDRHTNIIASFIVLKKDDQVLLAKRQNTGYHDGDYSLVAGHVELGETYTQAIIREAKEEANIDLIPNKLVVTYIQHRKSQTDGSERVDAYFLAEEWLGEIKNLEPEKCSDLNWFSIDKLPENIVPAVRHALECIQKDIHYSEFGW